MIEVHPDGTAVLRHTCWYCAKVQDSVTSADRRAAPGTLPKPGDIGMCIGCGTFGIFDADMSLRQPTPQEDAEIAQSSEARHASEAWYASTAIQKERDEAADMMISAMDKLIESANGELPAPDGVMESLRENIRGTAEKVRSGEMTIGEALALVEVSADILDPKRTARLALESEAEAEAALLKLATLMLSEPGQPPPKIAIIVVRKNKPASIASNVLKKRLAPLLRICLTALESMDAG